MARAVTLLDGVEGPAMELVTALVQCALVYQRRGSGSRARRSRPAAALLPECEDRGSSPWSLHNLVEIELEWASALRELGEIDAARERGERGLAAARGAAWRCRCRSCGATTASRWGCSWGR